ncbi:MAG TPA: zinc-binding alcohol dehydrogenase [Armatimonadetes bacterium]|nr:zinc-binding alcohol dehydrogenase [Armatimonadota bacterium]
MKAKRVAFIGERHAVLEEFELDETLAPHEIMIRTLYSIISAGTEGASFTGLEREHPGAREFSYPRYPGYGNVGEVIAVGRDVSDFHIGDIVLSTSPHASHWRVNTRYVCVRVPEDLLPLKAAFARMAAVSIAGIRKADYSLGDKVLVIGAGLVGNFAAQMFQLSGCDVMLVDVIESRLERARQCGIQRTVNASEVDIKQAVREWSGDGAQITIEAVGDSRLIAQAVDLTKRNGEVILLGSPRKRITMDVTPMLSRLHLLGITMKGALEWLYPVPESPFQRFTVIGNLKQIFQWLRSDSLKTEPLLTHLLSPADCQRANDGLDARKDEYLGVIFDWSRV